MPGVPRKFALQWFGPFEVVGKGPNPVTYRIRTSKGVEIVANIRHLVPYHDYEVPWLAPGLGLPQRPTHGPLEYILGGGGVERDYTPEDLLKDDGEQVRSTIWEAFGERQLDWVPFEQGHHFSNPCCKVYFVCSFDL